MIEILNGIHETVAYDYFPGIKLYHNTEAEDYPLHWHTAMEIIMPVRKKYTVVIDEKPHTFREGDIFITPPGTLHHLIAPKPDADGDEGERLIILLDYGLICNVKGMDSLIHSLHPYALIGRKEYPKLNAQLCSYHGSLHLFTDHPLFRCHRPRQLQCQREIPRHYIEQTTRIY